MFEGLQVQVPTSRPDRLLDELCPALAGQLALRNPRRFKINLSSIDIVAAIRLMSRKQEGCFGFLQPAPTRDHWYLRSIPAVGLLVANGMLHIRFGGGHAYRNGRLTPEIWEELRPFGLGDMRTKLEEWRGCPRTVGVQLRQALALPTMRTGADWRCYKAFD